RVAGERHDEVLVAAAGGAQPYLLAGAVVHVGIDAPGGVRRLHVGGELGDALAPQPEVVDVRRAGEPDARPWARRRCVEGELSAGDRQARAAQAAHQRADRIAVHAAGVHRPGVLADTVESNG